MESGLQPKNMRVAGRRAILEDTRDARGERSSLRSKAVGWKLTLNRAMTPSLA